MDPRLPALLLSLALTGADTDPRSRAEAALTAHDWKAAAAAYEQVVAAAPADGGAWFALAGAHLQMKALAPAAAAYEKAYALGTLRPISSYNLACVHALLGHPAEAFAWLERTVATGFTTPESLAADADLQSLHGDPRWATTIQAAERAAHPCREGKAREFDFWIGEWEVADAQGNRVGASSIQSILDGCVILENWTGRLGGTGKSFNLWDASHGRWQQTWVDDKGTLTEFHGEFKDGALRYTTSSPGKDGRVVERRLTFFPLSGGKVRQLSERTDDGGSTWSVQYDFVYTRKAG
jgi:hypothetical protein